MAYRYKTPTQEARAASLTFLAPICALAFAAAMVAPVGIDHGMLTMNSAQAEKGGNGNGNGPGNGNGNGPDSAPGKNKDGGGPGGGEPEASIGAEGDVSGGPEITAADMPLIAEDLPPANVEVIREIAGLPEQSGLSEEEELDAIRNGWGSWRTADAPAGTAIQ